ncbi:unnamed protein product [Victoria cruziana]
MGEEAPQEDGKAAEETKEEKPGDGADGEEKKGDGGKEDGEVKPPSPAILSVDINCPGCAKKVKRTILKSRGVEDVEVDMEGKQVTVKGVIDLQALCTKVERKTKMKASVISPILPAKEEPEMVNAQASGETKTVMLNVYMHCEPCALQLQKRILRMRGVQTAETDFATGKVTVTGTMDANKLVEYVYKRTRKQANIIPSPPPAVKEEEAKPAEDPEPEEKKEEDKQEEGKQAEEKKEEDKQGGGNEAEEKKEEGKVEEGNEEEKTEAGKEEEKEEGGGEEEKKGEEDGTEKEKEEGKDNQEENGGGGEEEGKQMDQDDDVRKMVYYPPVYVIERVYAPQLFSDENPNACCIL